MIIDEGYGFLLQLTCDVGATGIDSDAHGALCDAIGVGVFDAAVAAALSSQTGGSACTCT